MKVKDFVEKYNSLNDFAKEEYIKENIKNIYVPYTRKATICNSIVNATMKRTINYNSKDKEIFFSDSANRYILFQMKLIEEYTDIKFSEGTDAIKEFELLDQYGINDLIVASIPEREYANFKVILDMKVDDISINENNFIQYLDTKLDAIKLVFDTFGDSILNNIINNPEVLEAFKSVTNNENGKVDNIVSMK